MSDENIIRGCGCSQDEACNLCGFEACQLAWQEITKLRKGNEILRKMGEFYADESSWQSTEILEFDYWINEELERDVHPSEWSLHGGKRARQALKEYAELMGEE